MAKCCTPRQTRLKKINTAKATAVANKATKAGKPKKAAKPKKTKAKKTHAKKHTGPGCKVCAKKAVKK